MQKYKLKFKLYLKLDFIICLVLYVGKKLESIQIIYIIVINVINQSIPNQDLL
jgi:hypothetical protein